MKTQSGKVISISVWYLVIKLVIKLGIFVLLFLGILLLLKMFGSDSSSAMNGALLSSLLIAFIMFMGDLLYWKRSGVFINDEGDHMMKQGGWFVSEDKLLNGVVVANQVTRSPMDQLFGMATINAGILKNRPLTGVNYADIKNYDATMRKGMKGKFSTIF